MSLSRALSNLSEQTDSLGKAASQPHHLLPDSHGGHPVLTQVLTFLFLISPLLVSNLLPDWDIVSVPLPGGVPGGTNPSPPTLLYLPAAQIPDRKKQVSYTARSRTEIAVSDSRKDKINEHMHTKSANSAWASPCQFQHPRHSPLKLHPRSLQPFTPQHSDFYDTSTVLPYI